MLIKLKLHPILADQVGHLDDVQVPTGTNVAGLLAALGIDRDRAGFVLVNGHRTPYNAELHEEDTVFIIPFLGGG
ncbi:MAG: MoaD/ThiS family protein [Caldiserica bacterium]|nr:MoaD/ThiS family protein [Caldisericota bacterium]